jgi:hypothetical protein
MLLMVSILQNDILDAYNIQSTGKISVIQPLSEKHVNYDSYTRLVTLQFSV